MDELHAVVVGLEYFLALPHLEISIKHASTYFKSTNTRKSNPRTSSSFKSLSALTLAVLGLCFGSSTVSATPVLSADLASFAVLGHAGVTNVPTSTIGGNLGSAPNASVGGGYIFTAGSLQQNTALAAQAQLDLDAAMTTLKAMPASGGPLTSIQNGTTIAPGVYDFDFLDLFGDITLDGTGSVGSALWVFRTESTLITSTTSTVSVTNVNSLGSNVGIYWLVGSAATLNGSLFAGNVLALDLISSDGDLTIGCGRLLSATKQVTLIQDHISTGCTTNGFAEGQLSRAANGVPEPGTLALFGLGLAGLVLFRRRYR